MANSDQTPYLLPSSNTSINDLALHFSAINEQKRLQAERDKKEKEAHDFASLKYFGAQLDPTQFDSKTYLTDLTNKIGHDATAQLAENIKRGVSDEDNSQFVNQATAKMDAIYKKGTQAKAGIYEMNKAIKASDPGYDDARANHVAMDNYFYNTDPKTGARTLKDVKDLGDNYNDAIDYAQRQHEVPLYSGNQLGQAIEKGKGNTRDEAGSVSRMVNGHKHDDKFMYSLYRWQRLDKDSKGDNIVAIDTEMHPVRQADGTIKQVPILSRNAYEDLTKTHSALLQARDMAHADAKAHGINLTSADDEDLYARGMLPDMLPKDGRKQSISSGYSDQAAITNSLAQQRLDLAKQNHELAVERFQNTGKTKDATIISDINNAFDSLPDMDDKTGTKIRGGKVYEADGTLSNKPMQIKVSQLPDNLRNVIATYSKGNNVTGKGFDGDGLPIQRDYVSMDVKDGVPQNVSTDFGTKFPRAEALRAQVHLDNKERSATNKVDFDKIKPAGKIKGTNKKMF